MTPKPFCHAGFGLTQQSSQRIVMHRRSHHSGCWTCLPRTGLAADRIGLQFTLLEGGMNMHLRYRSVLLLVAICTALAVAPAFAANAGATATSEQKVTRDRMVRPWRCTCTPFEGNGVSGRSS